MNMHVSICTTHERQRGLHCCCELVYCTILLAGVTSGPASTDHSKAVSLWDGNFMICGKVAPPQCRNKRHVHEVYPTMLDIMGGECLNLCRFEGEGLLLIAI